MNPREWFLLAGVAGIGPAHVGFRDPCLTTWLHPKTHGIFYAKGRLLQDFFILVSVSHLFFSLFPHFKHRFCPPLHVFLLWYNDGILK